MKLVHPLLPAALVALVPLIAVPAPRGAGGVVTIDALPFVIERPGRYELARDMLAPPGVVALRIRASDVGVDLAGHRLIGQAGTLEGVVADEGLERIELRNGAVMRFGHDGVDLSGVSRARLERLELLDNGGHGAALGDDAAAVGISAQINHGGLGLFAGSRASLRNVRATSNLYGGVRAGPESMLVDCAAERSIYGPGLRAGAGSLLRRCEATDNDEGGIQADPGSTLIRCRSTGSLAFGLRAGERSLVLECEAAGTRDGPGLELGAGATADDCTAERNFGAGIVAGAGCVVRGSSARANDGAGIAAESALLVADNVCDGSVEGAGLALSGHGTTVRGNRARGNAGADLDVRGAGHVVVGNRARRGRFEVAEGSLVGPLVEDEAEGGGPLANVLEEE